MLSLRLLMARSAGGDVGYTMTADEVAFWQDMAALLDPAAYEWVVGASETRTVTAGECWYMQEGWNVSTSGGGNEWFHRGGDVRDALPLPEGTVLTLRSTGTPHMYLCKPSLVTSGDSRYTDDPRALYFNRLRRLSAELTHYRLGATQETAGQHATVSFPTDFTDGMIVHVSTQDLSWIIPSPSDEASGLITQWEISDIDQVRVAAVALIPFDRTVFPKLLFNGSGDSTGRGSVTYVKLPGDW